MRLELTDHLTVRALWAALSAHVENQSVAEDWKDLSPAEVEDLNRLRAVVANLDAQMAQAAE